jgi:tetratricopeptide (TPR) repeat protein
MSADKTRATIEKTATIPAPQANIKPSAPARRAVPPLFRRCDWLAMLIAFGLVWVTYMLTLAPELTLEDSGELCTGAFYAGIPHPPGYPVWTIYSWLWTVLLPFHNVAWRVEVGEATAAAFACGLVGLMVSRGSSMLMEGIEGLKGLTGKRETAICVVSGAVAGVLLGMGGVMWSESVAINRISLFGVPWMMTVMLCMLRWIYAPHQRRYLYFAMFFFGICLTIHQTLLVGAMGIEAAVALCQPRLGRTFFLGNSVIFIVGVLAHNLKATTAFDTDMILYIFYGVGIVSVAAYFFLAWFTKETAPEFGLDGCIAVFLIGMGMFAMHQGPFYLLLGAMGLTGFVMMAVRTWKIGDEWLVALICAVLWCVGAAFYFYEPIAGMTNPPMQWGYPRTWEGFVHAFTRGQYEKVNPTDIFGDPGRFLTQLGMLASDIAGEYNWVLALVALIPLFFFLKVQKRERAWLTCLAGTYFCISVLLIILMNPSDDRASADLHRVFFTSSHAIIAIFIGYGLALTAAYLATHYQDFKRWGLIGSGVLGALALLTLMDRTEFFSGIKGFSGQTSDNSNHFVRFVATWADCLVSTANWAAHAFGRLFEPSRYGPFFHDVFRAFQKDQFGLPIFGHLILLSLPLILLGALLVYRERAPLGIALCLFAALPLYSAMCHWGGSEQRNHWYGYWFGHDMFTPPFVGSDGKLSYDARQREDAMKGPKGDLVYPEMARDTILFGGTDPGRFCPTYMIFCESFIPHEDQPKQDQKFDRRDVYIITQNALADNTYLEYIRAHYNRSAQIDPPFFQEMLRSKKEVDDNYTTNMVARMAYQIWDRPLTALGASIEARRRKEGVYPPKEIYIPSTEDSQQCFSEYMADAQRRMEHDMRFPNEPRQIKQGEDVHTADNRVSVSGQTAVMSINGLLTKVIFDHNPSNEFYVEESFPLDWMYPYLSPYGIIMKINRQPQAELSEETVKRDHEFWSRYSERLIGNFITYDTSVKEITDFVDKVYRERNFTDFKGDRRFIRDDQAQKAFSKLRSSIAGSVYDWRYANSPNPVAKQRMLKEADFAYKEAFAFCPYSPEAVYRYIQLLVNPNVNRVDDAILVAQTCAKLDPNNLGVAGMVKGLMDYKAQRSHAVNLEQLDKEVRDNPNNFQAAFNLAQAYVQAQQRDKAMTVLDQVLANPQVNAPALIALAQAYSQLGNAAKLEEALTKLTQMTPDSPEAWHDLAALETAMGKTSDAMKDLQRCVEESDKRLNRDRNAANFRVTLATDAAFNALHQTPGFERLSSPK